MSDELVDRLIAAGNDGLNGLPLLMLTVEAANEIERLRAEVAEAKRRASNAEFERNCLEQVRLRDNQYLIDRAEKAERELAALRERIEKAPVTTLSSWTPDDKGKLVLFRNLCDSDFFGLCGHRVRLLVEDAP